VKPERSVSERERMYSYTIRSRYKMGSWVRYESKLNGSGSGTIVGIAYNDDESIYYFVDNGSGYVMGGIDPDDILEANASGSSE
jgi:hypothetical protein